MANYLIFFNYLGYNELSAWAAGLNSGEKVKE